MFFFGVPVSGSHPSTVKDGWQAKKTIGLQHLEPEIPRKTWIFFLKKMVRPLLFMGGFGGIVRYSRTAPKVLKLHMVHTQKLSRFLLSMRTYIYIYIYMCVDCVVIYLHAYSYKYWFVITSFFFQVAPTDHPNGGHDSLLKTSRIKPPSLGH